MTQQRRFYGRLIIVLLIGLGTLGQAFAQDSTRDKRPQNPIQLAYFYRLPENMELDELAQTADFLIFSRGDLSDEPDLAAELEAAGFEGLLLQYLRFDAIEGPAYLRNAGAGPCNPAQQGFSAYSNHVTNQPGEFCELHDSIVTGSAFDHDLNPATPDQAATEDWFVHNEMGERLGEYNEQWDGDTGFYYHINPGSQAMQEYWLARALRELQGAEDYAGSDFHGIFADNIELSWEKKVERLDVQGSLKEYSSEDSYLKQVQAMTRFVYDGLSSAGYPLYGNLIDDQSSDAWGWEQYLDSLDGAMLENFALSWDDPINPDSLAEQFMQISEWLAAGKPLLLVSQGDDDADEALYALAAYLMITDGQQAYFRHAHSDDYRNFWLYDSYDLALGMPLDAYTLLSPPEATIEATDNSSPDATATPEAPEQIYERAFECGTVQLNATRVTAAITLREGCTPG